MSTIFALLFPLRLIIKLQRLIFIIIGPPKDNNKLLDGYLCEI